MKLKLTAAVLALLAGGSVYAQIQPRWLRYPAISPDGKTIAFGYKGDIYRVSSEGGVAIPLTIHEAQDMMPVWSPDGTQIAFASDRHGNMDVFVMPSTGGSPRRLTNNSANDYPSDFNPAGTQVIFSSGRQGTAASVRYPYPGLFYNLYTVPAAGGRSLLLSSAGVENAHYNSDGTQLIFQDRKGYEDAFRKHQTSSVARDVWMYDLASKKYKQLSQGGSEFREPVFGGSGDYYYLAEPNAGNQNVFKASLGGGAGTQLTRFSDNPVRHLSRSKGGMLCFSQNGDVYTLREGEQPKKLSVQIMNDGRDQIVRNVAVSGGVREFALSPNGKEIAFVNRGEVFVAALEGGQTRRITNTPQQERMVAWSPDGKTLIYSAERNNNWDIYKVSVARREDPYFYTASLLKEEPLIATAAEEYQPEFSPDGKEIAYIENRNALKVMNLATKATRTLLPLGRNFSYSDGDWGFQWSPDSKYLLVDDSRGYAFSGNSALIKADGSGSITHPINSGFGDFGAKWGMGNKMILWTSERNGRRSLAIQGSREVDVYAVFTDKAAYDRFILNEEEMTLLKEKEDRDKKDSVLVAERKKQDKADSIAGKKNRLELDNLEDRQIRLTINSSSISDYILNDEATKLYYLSSFEKGYDLWVTDTRTKETKILAKLGGSGSGIELSKDGKFLIVANNGNLVKVNAESGKVSPVSVSGEMSLDAAGERTYIFEHAWRQVKEKFYDPKLHGINWEGYKANYAQFLPHIGSNYDFQDLLSEMLGELNASHTGARYRPRTPMADGTACLGILFDETYTGPGLKVSEVLAGGPADKADFRIQPGNLITEIDGEAIPESGDWAGLLNRKYDRQVLLTVVDAPGGKTRNYSVKATDPGVERDLMYRRWVRRMESMVDRLSGGKVGYVHVESMNDDSYREVFDRTLGRNLEKQALIVDTRSNGGGWLHDDLNTFLSGKNYLQFAPQSQLVKGGEPANRWTKPSCVLMSENNYSDAFIFPYIYKQNGLGKLIGMPVAGTGTAVWWESQIDPTIVFGIPMIATIGKEGRPTENMQVEPDIRVPLPYEDFLAGRDPQIEAAVKEMMKVVK